MGLREEGWSKCDFSAVTCPLPFPCLGLKESCWISARRWSKWTGFVWPIWSVHNDKQRVWRVLILHGALQGSVLSLMLVTATVQTPWETSKDGTVSLEMWCLFISQIKPWVLCLLNTVAMGLFVTIRLPCAPCCIKKVASWKKNTLKGWNFETPVKGF